MVCEKDGCALGQSTVAVGVAVVVRVVVVAAVVVVVAAVVVVVVVVASVVVVAVGAVMGEGHSHEWTPVVSFQGE